MQQDPCFAGFRFQIYSNIWENHRYLKRNSRNLRCDSNIKEPNKFHVTRYVENHLPNKLLYRCF